MIFKYTSQTLDQTIEWSWSDECQEKQYWQTWIPKKSDLKIRTKLKRDVSQQVKDELWEDLQGEIQMTRDIVNAKRRKKSQIYDIIAQLNTTLKEEFYV
jgi:hypothetical protein